MYRNFAKYIEKFLWKTDKKILPAKGRQAFYREVLGFFVFSLRKKCVLPRYRTRTRITCGTAFSFSMICAVVAAFMPLTSSMV